MRHEEVDGIQFGEHCKYRGGTHLPNIIKKVEAEFGYPNVVILENQKNMQKYSGLSEVDCLRVLYLGDYLDDGRGNIAQYNKLINKHKINLVLCPTPKVVRLASEYRRRGFIRNVDIMLLPYSVDTDVYRPLPGADYKYDVMAVFGLVSYIYPMRPVVQDAIRKMKGVKSLVGEWRSNIKHYDYARELSSSKIFVSVNGIHNQITMKYTEAMASGTLLITNEPEDFAELGYKSSEHCIIWYTIEDLEDKIFYYLKHEEERKMIAEAGMSFVRKNYSCNAMADRLIKGIKYATGDSSKDSEVGEYFY